MSACTSLMRCGVVAIVTPLQTAHADILDKEVIGSHARYLASGKANNNQPTAPCHRAQRSSEEVTSEGVNYDICTDAARGRVGPAYVACP